MTDRSESDNQLFSLHTRISILESHNINKIREDINSLNMKVHSLEIAQNEQNQNWKTIINFVVQVIWVVMAAYILLKLGLQPPI